MSGNKMNFCSRCGRALDSSRTRYLVTVHLVADFDGSIDVEESAGEDRRMWKKIEKMSERELNDEVSQDMCFVLCKPCRDEWVRSPFGEYASEIGAPGSRLH